MGAAGVFLPLTVIVCLLLITGRAQDDFCFSNDVRISDRVEMSEPIGNGLLNETVYGLLEICVNGRYLSVCNSSGIDPMDVARRGCDYIGYSDSDYFLDDGRFTDSVITSIDCPDYSFYGFSDCALSPEMSSQCPVGDDLYVYCQRESQLPTYCSESMSTEFRTSAYFNLDNGDQYSVGFPLLCIDNTLTPFCVSDLQEQQLLADSICSSGEGTPGPLLGMSSEYTLDFSVTSSINDFQCDNYSDISTCQFIQSDSCFMDYNLVTCLTSTTSCFPRDVYSTDTISVQYPSSYRSASTKIETCSNDGERIDICNDGLLDEGSLVSLICPSLGYSQGYVSMREDISLSSTGLFAVDIDCIDTAFSFYDCNYNVSESCDGVPLVLECYSVCQNGETRLYNPRSNYTDNTQLTITGIAEVCVDGQWLPFCDDGSGDYDSSDHIAVTACQSLGYTGGDILPADPANYGSSGSPFSLFDVDCPFFFTSFTDCSYNITDDGVCGDTSNRLLIQCSPSNEMCFDSVSLASRVDIGTSSDSYVIGYPQLCSLDGTYAAICSDIVQDYEVEQICNSIGYSTGSLGAAFGTNSDYRQLLRSSGVFDYMCPDDGLGLSDCTFNFTSGTGCTRYGGVELVTCSNGGDTCSEGVRLSPSGTGNLPNGDSLYIGYLEACVNGSYEPLCHDALDMDVLQVACYNLFGPNHIAYSYPLLGDTDDYASDLPSSDTGVYMVDCSYNQYAMFGACDPDTLEYTTTGGCGQYGGYPVVSCQSVMNAPPPVPDSCNNTGDVRLIDQITISDPQGVVGVLEICVNGSYTRVCANDTYADIDVPGLADIACSTLGYPSNTFNSISTTSFYFTSDSNIIDFVDCPPFTTDLSMCSIETTNDTECSTNLFDAYLTCFNLSDPVIPECFIDGQARIRNNITTNSTEEVTITGQLEICVDGQYRPVCGVDEEVDYDVELSSIVQIACEDFGYTDSSYMLNYYGSTPAIDYISCGENVFLSLLGCNYSTTDNGTCTDSDYRSSVRITCSREARCIDGEVRLSFESPLPDQGFGPGIGGYIEICVDGEYASVCVQEDHSSVDVDELGRLACYDLGYHPDETVSFTYGVVRFFQDGGVIDEIDCPEDANTLSLCSVMTNDTGACASHTFDAFLQCYNVSAARVCYDGDLILTEEYEFNYTGDPMLPFITGYPAICRDNEYVPICDNGDLTVYEARYACAASTPYSFGFIGSTSSYNPPSIEYDGDVSAVNTTCGFDECSFEFSNEPCDTGFAVISCGIMCSENDTRLLNESLSYTSDGLERLTGIPQVCSDGGWVSVCNDGTNDPALPTAICQQDYGYRYGRLLPYDDASLYGPSPRGTIYVNDVYCPEIIENYFEDCNENLTMCADSGQYVIECYDYEVCAPGYIEVTNSVEYTSPEGYYYTSGYPEICVDDQYVPLCDNTMPGPLELFSICYTAVNLTYGLRGTPSFLSVDPYSDGTSYVVTEFDCGYEDCTNTTVSSNDGCTSYGGYSTVTCARVCDDDDKRLYNERNYTTSDGLLRVVGIPQTCVGGGWESICNDGSNDDNLPNLICQDAGYRGGNLVPSNRTLYGASEPGSFYLTDVTCIDSVYNCTGNYTFTDECLSGDYDYTVECYNISSSPSIVEFPVSLNVTASSTVTFTCQFTGDPTPQVQWTFIPPSPRQPMPIIPSTGPHTVTTSIDGDRISSTLTVSSVMISNAGLYTCSASNGAPVQPSGTAMLLVIVPPTITLISNTDTSDLQETDIVNITCTESGAYPSLPIVWFKGTTLIFSAPPRVSISYTTTLDMTTQLYTVKSDLIISMAALADTGSYTCRTSPVPIVNQPVISNALSINIAVRNECVIDAPTGQPSPCVNGYCIDGLNSYFCQCFDGFTGDTCTTPVTTTSTPMFKVSPSDTSVLLGETASLDCIVAGEPQPTITWYKDGEVIPQQTTPTLIIVSVDASDRGVYSCEARNSEGTITSDGALLRIENVAQYESFLSVGSSSRRKRQQQLPDNFPGFSEAKALAEGREVAPNAVIASLDGYLLPNDPRIQLIITVRTAVNDDGRPVTTGVISGLTVLTNDIAEARPDLSFSQIQRFDGCVPEDTSLFGSVQLEWPEIGAGENASLPCPCGQISDNTGVTATRMCQGNFITISEWLTPDISRCRYDRLSQEICNASANDGVNQGAEVLSSVASSAESFTGDTLGIAAAFLSDLSSSTITDEVASTLVEAIGKMTLVPSSEVESESANEILQSIDTLINNIPSTSNGQASVVEPNIAISVQDVDLMSFTGVTFGVSTNSDGTLGEDALSGEVGQATVSVDVPSNVLANVFNATRIGFAVQTSDIFFVQSSSLENRQTPVSVIISLDVFDENGKVEINDLQQTIDFKFTVEDEVLCVFWNASSSIWSSDGCTTVPSNSGSVTCQCNHLSSFTVLDNSQSTTATPTSTNEPGTSGEEEYNVEPIIIVGGVISGIIICLAVVSHLMSSRQRYSQEGKILISSHLCLIVLYIILVLASIASYTDSTGFCGTFSGLFHYMSLVYAMWIFTEGLYYVIKLKYGIGGNSVTRYLFRIMFVTSFAVPLVIVIISAGAGYDYYAVDNSFCRPQSYPFYYGYIIPIGLIYISGIICLIMGTFVTLLSSMKGSEAAFRKQLIRPHVLAAIILHLIILVAWIFGTVGTDNGVIGEASTATQYIFGFSLIIHAIVLLLLTLFRTEDTRECWLTVFNCITGRRGKYNLDTAGNGHMTEENIYVARKRDDAEGIGLEASGRVSREGSIKKDLSRVDNDDVTTPLKDAEDAVDTAFSSNEGTLNQEANVERETNKDELGSVIANPSADINEEDDADKKTDL